tara:strand:+ start:342 stop:710 length:369 start_codon:yes stop_codon:yes gene_type:complete
MSENNNGAKYEQRDVPVRKVLYAGVLLVVFVAVSLAFVAFLTGLFSVPDREPVPVQTAERPVAGPRLEVDHKADLDALNARNRRFIETYGRSEDGRVRIPVDRAIDILADRGWPNETNGGGP